MKKWNILTLSAVVSLVLIPSVQAHCPLCTAAVGTGVMVTRFYGVDDTIAGVWIGALIISTALWLSRVLKEKYGKKVPLQSLSLSALAFLSTAVPFYLAGLIGNPDYTIFGMDKLLLGMLTGSVMTWLGTSISGKIRDIRNRVFPFQTIAVTLISLVLTSTAFWLVVR